LKLHHELAIKKGMSYEATSNIVDLALCKLPYMGTLYEQANEEVSKKQDGVDYLENHKYSLKKEKEIFAYYYEHNEANRLQPLPSSYSLLGLPDLSTQNNNKQTESKQKEEIREVYKGDIAE
jgi:hypothetical protein